MKKTVALLAVTVLLFSTLAIAWTGLTYKVILHNPLDQKLNYWIDWIDHPWRDDPRVGPAPIEMAGGEINPKETEQIHSGLPEGHFILTYANARGGIVKYRPVMFTTHGTPEGAKVILSVRGQRKSE